MKLLLASGLSVLSPNSFSRQLRLLGDFLGRRGHEIVVAGVWARAETSAPGQTLFDVQIWDADTFGALCGRFSFDRMILIGYADQFRFLDDLKYDGRIFFWYQCSRAYLPSGLENTLPIPLTAATRAFLTAAGHGRIGPTIPHGVDTHLFAPSPSSRARGREPVLCSVGANSFRKRFDLLFESFSILLDSIPDARLAIKTDRRAKPGGYDLDTMAGDLGISGQVDILDYELSDAELAAFYAEADLYVHTAEWEGFGIPVIEAMACGLPVLTHPVQGPGELVPYPKLLVTESDVIEDEGTLLKKIQPAALAACVRTLLAHPGTYARAVKLGREAAVSKYDIRLIAQVWEKIF